MLPDIFADRQQTNMAGSLWQSRSGGTECGSAWRVVATLTSGQGFRKKLCLKPVSHVATFPLATFF